MWVGARTKRTKIKNTHQISWKPHPNHRTDRILFKTEFEVQAQVLAQGNHGKIMSKHQCGIGD